jgi:hypothetical protein
MTRLYPSPQDPADDEVYIARGYQNWSGFVSCAIPLIVAYFVHDLTWVVAVCASVVLSLLRVIEGRLYDLCIRTVAPTNT